MAIDGCTYSFIQLTRDVLPGYMAKHRVAMKSPHAMSLSATREGLHKALDLHGSK